LPNGPTDLEIVLLFREADDLAPPAYRKITPKQHNRENKIVLFIFHPFFKI
jgi:hypothetical protein